MNQDNIFTSFFMLELTNGFQERLTFDVTNGSADFNNGNFRILSGWIAIKTGFDFVCNMWDNLNRSSAKISTAFLLKNRPVNLTGCYVGILAQTFIDESFIMSKVKVGLSTIISYKYFTMLYRVHSTRVNVDVWIKFLHCNCVTTSFQQTSERCSCNPLT